MEWVTSDLHLNHDKDFIYKARGFETVQEMNEAIINRFNSKVKPDDTVYILGDVCLGDTEASIPLIKLLNGKKYLAYGNHDTDNRISRFLELGLFKDVLMGYRVNAYKRVFVLTHYPTLVANPNEKYVINLHGHTHSKDPFQLFGDSACYNVALDAHDCYPVSFPEILFDINKRAYGQS